MMKSLDAIMRDCLYLGEAPSVIEAALRQLDKLEGPTLETYFDLQDTRIAPLLYSHLKRLHLTDRLAPHHLEILHRHNLQNRCRNTVLHSHLVGIAREARTRGIELLLMKGAATLVDGKAGISEGFVLGDLDILVYADELGRMRDLLLSLDFQLVEHDRFEDNKVKEGFVGANGLVAIDVHTDLFWTGCRLAYSACFASDYRHNSVPACVGGCPVRTLAQQDAVPYQILHDLVAHPQGLLWTTTTRIYRLCRMFESRADSIGWRETIDASNDDKLQQLMLAYVRYAARELGVRITDEWRLPERLPQQVWIEATARAPRSIQAVCYELFVSGGKKPGGLAETFIRLLGGSWELAACPGRGLFWIPRRLAVVTVALLYVLFTRAAPIRVERGPEGDTGNTEEDNARQRFETNRAR